MTLISEKWKTNGLSCATAPVSGMKVMSRLKHMEVKPLYTVSWISGKKKLTEISKTGYQEESSAQSESWYLQKGSFKSWKDSVWNTGETSGKNQRWKLQQVLNQAGNSNCSQVEERNTSYFRAMKKHSQEIPHTHVYIHVECSNSHTSQGMEPAYMPINRWITKNMIFTIEFLWLYKEWKLYHWWMNAAKDHVKQIKSNRKRWISHFLSFVDHRIL